MSPGEAVMGNGRAVPRDMQRGGEQHNNTMHALNEAMQKLRFPENLIENAQTEDADEEMLYR